MRITAEERQSLVEIVRDEMEAATRRMGERLSRLEGRPASSADTTREGVRRFYEELADKVWSEADEECLASLGDMSDAEIKAGMREAFRRSMLQPIPSFRYLMNLGKKPESPAAAAAVVSRSPDAVSAAERERLANLLSEQLTEAAAAIVSQLGLTGAKAAILREHLEVAEGQIIGRFTPLI